MTRHVATTCTRFRPYGDPRAWVAAEAYRRADLAGLAETPWRLRAAGEVLTIRRSTPMDLAAVAAMHRRCSPQTMLDRYRLGGRPPAVMWLDRMLREPLSFVAATKQGTVVAGAVASRDPQHSPLSAELAVIVQDSMQGEGIGAELASHLAGAALVAGYAELIAYPGTVVMPAQRLMSGIGRTRVVLEAGETHLHTALPEGAGLGIGAVRERLAG